MSTNAENHDDIEEVMILENVNQEIVSQVEKAQIDTQIATAKQFPRNVTRAINNAIAIVTLDEETAASCNYSLPRGGKTLSGVSIHCARILFQNWGNMNAGARVVAIDDKHVTAQAICWDLENNVRITVEVKRSILQHEYKAGKKTGGMIRMNDDMITVTGNAANAIALRNAILNVIPRGVIDKVYKAAKQTITGDLSDGTKLIAKRTEIFKKLKDEYSVTEEEALAALGKPSISNVTADDILIIFGVMTAIKDGDTNVNDAFRNGKGSKVALSAEELKKRHLEQNKRIKSLIEELTENIPPAELPNLKRIVEKKETNTYDKAENYLVAIKSNLSKDDKEPQ